MMEDDDPRPVLRHQLTHFPPRCNYPRLPHHHHTLHRQLDTLHGYSPQLTTSILNEQEREKTNGQKSVKHVKLLQKTGNVLNVARGMWLAAGGRVSELCGVTLIGMWIRGGV